MGGSFGFYSNQGALRRAVTIAARKKSSFENNEEN